MDRVFTLSFYTCCAASALLCCAMAYCLYAGSGTGGIAAVLAADIMIRTGAWV